MKVYIPVYDRGWHTVDIETTIARLRKSTIDGSYTIFYHGTIYNGNNIFTDPNGCELWIARQEFKAHNLYGVDADSVKWAMVG